MEVFEIFFCICLIVLVNVKADIRTVIMAAAFYLAAVIHGEGKR